MVDLNWQSLLPVVLELVLVLCFQILLVVVLSVECHDLKRIFRGVLDVVDQSLSVAQNLLSRQKFTVHNIDVDSAKDHVQNKINEYRLLLRSKCDMAVKF